MIDELERKLTIELQEAVTSERQVVYILVQMRKLMDRTAEELNSPSYPTLRLYCNWVAHIGLSFGEARTLVAQANDLYPRLMAENTSPTEKAGFWETYTFAALRADIDRFILTHRLPAITHANWNNFITCLLPVLEDCPLTVEAKQANPLEIDKIVLRREMGQPYPDPNGSLPRIVWGFFKGTEVRLWVTVN